MLLEKLIQNVEILRNTIFVRHFTRILRQKTQSIQKGLAQSNPPWFERSRRRVDFVEKYNDQVKL